VAGASADALAFVRGEVPGGSPVLVVVNAGDGPVDVPVRVPELAGTTLVDRPLPGEPAGSVAVAGEGSATVAVPGRTGRILIAAAG
jgi:hypothetical protein